MNITKINTHLALVAILLGAVLARPAGPAKANPAQAPLPLAAPVAIYGDSLSPSWQDWSWDTTRNLSNSNPVQSGKSSVSIAYDKAWAGFYLHAGTPVKTAGYTHLEFYIHGGATGGQRIFVVANGNSGAAYGAAAVANAWKKISVPLSSLGSPATLADLYFQDATGTTQPVFYLDSLSLVDNSAPATPTATPRPLSVTATAAKAYLPTITSTPLSTTNTASIYADSLAAGWQDWSWGSTRNLGNTSPVQSGSASIAVQITTAWGALYLRNDAGLSTSGYSELRFWIHGGTTGGQKLTVTANKSTTAVYSLTATANTWRQFIVPLSSLGSPARINDLFWQDASGAAQSAFYLDGISLAGSGGAVPSPTPPVPTSGLALRIDASANKHPISPDIYGMNFASEALAKELRLPVRRFGGNATTRYNWQNDTSNRASDWFFENIPNTNSNPALLPDGSSSDLFVEQDRRTGTATLMTVPLIGWTPKSREITCGFAVSKYGNQQSTDPYRPDCGNGVRPDGTKITGNAPGDTSVAIGPAFVSNFVKHLVGRYGTAANGGVKFYNLDNEPMLWNSTHRDVHPNPASYDEIRDRTYQYAAAIKSADPTAKTLGPVLWGWTAYFYSALDAAQGGDYWNHPQDRQAHGNTPFLDWYLQQMKAYEQSHGQRILDYLDLHYYPQSGVALASAGDAATQAKRLRSTRSLWDASYTDESWINEPVRLIPRMRDWVNKNYPGTKLAISEYNFGGLESINGALAQADVLGIFGREALDLATLWAPPEISQPGAYAFRMYRNYDGKGSAFGNTSVQATSSNQGVLSVYAAVRSGDGALTLMVVNKTSSSQKSSLSIANFSTTAAAQVYYYSPANLKAILRTADQPVNGGSFSATFPASSITLIVIPKQ